MSDKAVKWLVWGAISVAFIVFVLPIILVLLAFCGLIGAEFLALHHL